MVTLNLNPDVICTIVDKAREFQAQEGVVIPETPEDPDEEDALQILADHKKDLTYEELRHAIDDLEPDQRASLIALMYLGRGDFDVSEWDEAMKASVDNLEHTAEYLLKHPHVADFLLEGLHLLGYSCNE